MASWTCLVPQIKPSRSDESSTMVFQSLETMCELRLGGESSIDIAQAGKDAVHQDLDPGAMLNALVLAFQCRFDRPAVNVAENEKEGRVKVRSRILNAAGNFRREDAESPRRQKCPADQVSLG